jgi:hypothetical protein
VIERIVSASVGQKVFDADDLRTRFDKRDGIVSLESVIRENDVHSRQSPRQRQIDRRGLRGNRDVLRQYLVAIGDQAKFPPGALSGGIAEGQRNSSFAGIG